MQIRGKTFKEWSELPVGPGKYKLPLISRLMSSHWSFQRAGRWLRQECSDMTDEEVRDIVWGLKDLAKIRRNLRPEIISPLEAAEMLAAPLSAGIRPARQAKIEQQVEDDVMTISSDGERIKTLAQLIDAADVDLDVWDVDQWKANVYETQAPGGKALPLWQVKANLIRRPDWLMRPARILSRPPTPEPSLICSESVLFIPDSQNGYVWSPKHDRLEPLHDRLAWDVVMQVAEKLQPGTIFLLGDMVDVANLSTKFHRHPSVRYTTQPTIDELHWWLHRLRSVCPNSRIIYQCGNHEERLDKLMMDQASELVGLRRAGEARPLMTWRSLLNLDELHIESIDHYGESVWLWDNVLVHHGEVVRGGGGKTARAVSAQARYSEVFGHVHRLEHSIRTVHGPDGAYAVHALSPGCLCRIDGTVPGVSKRPDWQQGFGLGFRINGKIILQAVPILDGVSVLDRLPLVGVDRSAEIAFDTGWSQFTSPE